MAEDRTNYQHLGSHDWITLVILGALTALGTIGAFYNSVLLIFAIAFGAGFFLHALAMRGNRGRS